MIEIRKTAEFTRWFDAFGDKTTRARIDMRIARLALGNAGDVKSVGGGVSELRLQFGPGYRVYFVQRGNALVILLCGGDKSSQSRDIAEAQRLAKEV